MEIHKYDIQSGKHSGVFPSFGIFEKEHGLYRGSVRDILKYNGGKRNNILISIERHDIHPLYNGVPLNKLIEPIKVKDERPKENLLSEDELRIKHDMYYMIQIYLNGMPDGKFVEESAMLRQLSLLGKPRYREALSRHELKEYKGRVDGVTYYGSPASIKKLKSEGILQ